jgi:hypothetical protein
MFYGMIAVLTLMSQARSPKADLVSLKGRAIWHFLPILLARHREIAQIRIQTYRPAPKLSERLKDTLSETEHEHLLRVDEIRKSTGVPFWDVLLGIAMREGKLDTRLAQAALLHDLEQMATTFTFASCDFSLEALEEVNTQISHEEGLVLCSKVILANGDLRHIPMMDFRCPPSSSNASAIAMLVHKTGQKEGLLVESGHSYHLYCTSLLTAEEWTRFMAVCLLLSPVTDPRYIAHRLTDGECRLKISSVDRTLPSIVDVILA